MVQTPVIPNCDHQLGHINLLLSRVSFELRQLALINSGKTSVACLDADKTQVRKYPLGCKGRLRI